MTCQKLDFKCVKSFTREEYFMLLHEYCYNLELCNLNIAIYIETGDSDWFKSFFMVLRHSIKTFWKYCHLVICTTISTSLRDCGCLFGVSP